MPQNGMILLVLGITLLALTLYEVTMGGSALSPLSVYQYAVAAGFSGEAAIIATAIAGAESGFNPSAQGDLNDPITGQYNAFGLWQINTGENPQYTGTNLSDPQTNANAAFALYQAAGNSFSPWSTFNSGAYQSFVSQVEAVI